MDLTLLSLSIQVFQFEFCCCFVICLKMVWCVVCSNCVCLSALKSIIMCKMLCYCDVDCILADEDSRRERKVILKKGMFLVMGSLMFEYELKQIGDQKEDLGYQCAGINSRKGGDVLGDGFTN